MVKAINRVRKLLETANIKLASVVTDVMGVSGRTMLNALDGGNPEGAAAVFNSLSRDADAKPGRPVKSP